MQHPLKFYTKQQSKLNNNAKKIAKKIKLISLARFICFIITALLTYVYSYKIEFASTILIVGLLLFTFFVIKNLNLKKQLNLIYKKIAINTTEIDVLRGDFFNLDTGIKFTQPDHYFSTDIDLFGQGSFFQYVNRTVTNQGRIKLAKTLLSNDTSNVENKQKILQELVKKVAWRQHFSALASLVKIKKPTEKKLSGIINYSAIFSNKKHWLPKVFSIFSFIIISLVLFGILPFSILTIWFFTGLLLSAYHFKKTNFIYTKTYKAKETIKQYYVLLKEIETEVFYDEILKSKQNIIKYKEKKASTIVRQLFKILDAFDQRNNIVIALFGNGLFLWDLKNACATEMWLTSYKNTIRNWFEVVAFFDAQNSLANFVFNNPDFVFPKINASKGKINAVNLGHPLLLKNKRINNNFSIKEADFQIITGANMAGKSTFLRTVSLALVMANCGLPVCASDFTYSPSKLLTSMRTSDSLKDNESYFYSELKRLKFIVDEIHKEEYFIILDEILKGTNSKDKAIGSKKFVEKLSKSNATGIIATHDISLCELENKYESITNYYFDATVTENELLFDYKLKKGICKNMNASFLLKKMQII